jgi:ribonuclease R
MSKTVELAERVETLLHEQTDNALNAAEIATALKLRGAQHKRLQSILHDLVGGGRIVRIRGNRFAVGEAADLVTGALSILRSGNGIVAGDGKSVFVPVRDQSTALPGDRVVVRLDSRTPGDRPGMHNGKVIRIIERARHEIVGTLRTTGRFLYVLPVDPSYGRDIYVPEAGDAKVGDRVLCRFVSWANKHVNPEGIVLETLGSADDPSTDTLAIIKHYGLPEAFPAEVVREAEQASGLMDKPGRRENCRELVTFTIDPARARDFDDALSLERGSDGSVEVGVHIADVSHFVRPGTALDREAARRGNSVYLPDAVLPMLPEQLSNGICSLRPNEDRLAFSVFMTLDNSGRVKSSRFARTVIQSRARLTYEQAMTVIDGKPPKEMPHEVRERIPRLNRIAQQLRTNRFARYALDLEMPECEIVMGAGGRVEDVRAVAHDRSHQLVEEFMVAANEAVARELAVRGLPLISRLHEPPKPEKIADLQAQLAEMGYEPGDLSKPRNLAHFLQSVADDPLVMHVRLAVLRSLNRALYSSEANGHFGLAKTYYAHFTSPIRRYPDLTVHRQLGALVNRRRPAGSEEAGASGVRPAYTKKELAPIADTCSQTELTADEAERALEEIKKYRYLAQVIADQSPRTFEAVVVSIVNFGAFVELVGMQLQGLVHVSELSDRFMRFDKGSGTLRAGKTVYRVGTRLQVAPARVDFDKRQIDFVPA